ncbi:glycosyltransferase family 4 protein [Dokdonella fugitiva]|nr:glycosyltransferase family 4 protein [Dokdonella fugitiva]
MSVLFMGKRHYTNRDALVERYGRIYQLPWHWANAGIRSCLWLVDYHGHERVRLADGALDVQSTPVFSLATLRRAASELRPKSRESGPRTIIASGDCYIGLLAYRLAQHVGATFVFDVYDKYDEFAGYRRIGRFDPFRFLRERSDARLFASRALMRDLGDPQSDLLVPNGVDTARFRPLDMRDCRRAVDLPEDALLVGYFGGMEPDRGVEDLIIAVRRLRDAGSHIELLLGGKPPAGLDLGGAGIRFIGNVPFARMPEMLASCNLLAVPYRRSVFMDAGASNKIAEAIACGRPIVATRTPNLMANFPEQAACLGDLLAEPGDPADLERAIRAQLAERRLVDLPEGMAWADISAALARQLRLAAS